MKTFSFLRRCGAALLVAGAFGAGPAQAAVSAVPYADIEGTLASFEELALSDPLGTLLDGPQQSGGIWFGERFDGQELAVRRLPRPGAVAQDWFDDLSFGTPLPGLTLLAGATGANLGLYDYGDAAGQALAGIGPQNSDGSDPFGFGSIAARFAQPVSALGLQIRDSDGGAAWLQLYRDDGSLIARLELAPLADGFVAFARDDGIADIAGFSLHHADTYYGIAIDQLVAGQVAVIPEPAVALQWSAGLLAMGLWLRVRRRPQADTISTTTGA